MQEIVSELAISCSQAMLLVAGLGYTQLSYLLMVFHGDPQMSQTGARIEGWCAQVYCGTPFARATST